MERGVLAVFGYTSASSAYTIKTYTNLYKLPFISLSHPIYKYRETLPNRFNNFDLRSADEANNEIGSVYNPEFEDTDEKPPLDTGYLFEDKNNLSPDYQINMFPDMVPLLVSLIKYNRWKSVYYVYNHEEGKDSFGAFIKSLNLFIFGCC